ncbi:hypothetical protein, partial [Serratia entomophila]|uniref:hypothetical protein n=1 Tax=Serratia entomophila TaxID=42906 RepID=UPI0021B7A622
TRRYFEGRVKAVKFQYKQWINLLAWFFTSLDLEPQGKLYQAGLYKLGQARYSFLDPSLQLAGQGT